MRLRAIRLRNVRRFTDTGIQITDIGDGVNVLSAQNERGKSTCFDALHALFFLPHGSQGAETKSLKPYAGGSPEVSVDVETDKGLFRVEKKFFAGKYAKITDLASNRVIAQADEAEAWIDALIRAGSNGPAGLLWVRQGMTGLEPAKEKEKTAQFSARQDLLSSVAGEVEALTGGRRMDAVLALCTQELGVLVTATGKPKTGSPYKDLCDQIENMTERQDKLLGDLTALRNTLDERSSVERELIPFSDEAAAQERQKSVLSARQTLNDAREYTEQLKSAKTTEELAEERLKSAAGELETFDALTADLVEKQISLKGCIEAEELAAKKQGVAAKADAQAANAHDLAEKASEGARRELKLARSAEAAAVARKRLTELEAQLKKSEDLQAKASQSKAAAEEIQIHQTDVNEIEQLDADITLLKARRDALAVTVSVTYETGKTAGFELAGQVMEEDSPIPILRETRIDVTGIGSLFVSPGASDSAEDLGAQVAKAEAKLKENFERLSLTNVAAARTRLKEQTAFKDTERTSIAALEALAPDGIEDLRSAFSDAKSKAAANILDTIDPEQAEVNVTNAENAHREVATSREEFRKALSKAQQHHVACSTQRASTETTLSRADEALGLEETRDDRRQTLERAVSKATTGHSDALKLLEKMRASAPDLETAQAVMTRAEGAVNRASEDRTRLEKRLAELNATINARADDAVEEEYEEIRGRLKSAHLRQSRFETEVRTLLRLKEALEAARGAAKEQYFGPVTEELRPLLSILYDTAEVIFDDTSLLPKALLRDGLEEEIDVLSGGTREQIAILTRLAFARLLAKDGRPTPVILDDALIYSDDDRIEKMFNALHRQARDLQIIIFTCRQRAFQSLGGHGLAIEVWD